MKLLIDNNLSYKLCIPLQSSFPGTAHIRELLNVKADDLAIWSFAKENDYIILTKDNDFNERSIISGCPPKVIQLVCGNKSTSEIRRILLSNISSLLSFASADSSDCILKLS